MNKKCDLPFLRDVEKGKIMGVFPLVVRCEKDPRHIVKVYVELIKQQKER